MDFLLRHVIGLLLPRVRSAVDVLESADASLNREIDVESQAGATRFEDFSDGLAKIQAALSFGDEDTRGPARDVMLQGREMLGAHAASLGQLVPSFAPAY